MKRLTIMLMLALSLSACANRQFIMPEKDINKIEEQAFLSYNVYWLEIHPVLFLSEGSGVRHNLFLEQPLDNKKSFSGVRVKNRLLIIAEADLSNQKCIISSRSGRNFYTVDGKNIFSKNGYLVPKLDWSKIKLLGETGIEIWENIKLDSEQDKQIQTILINIGKGLDNQKIPGLFDRVMSQVAKITTDDIILAGATDFSSLFGIFGVRIWSLVQAIVQKADLYLPYYDTALVDRFQLGLTLEKLGFNKWNKEMQDYQQKKEQYERDYKEWLQLRMKQD